MLAPLTSDRVGRTIDRRRPGFGRRRDAGTGLGDRSGRSNLRGHHEEYNGKGEPVPGGKTGKSECSYSGKDVDDAVEGNPPGFDDDAITAVGNTRVQSYGMIVRIGGKAGAPSPGFACSPGRPVAD